MVASAEEVARRRPSGENFRQVMPRAWALGMVWRRVKFREAERLGSMEEGDRVAAEAGV